MWTPRRIASSRYRARPPRVCPRPRLTAPPPQSVIRSRFAGCTIFTVAHRLNTVLDSDMMLVMDAGRVVEYGPPSELLQDRSSRLSGFGLAAAPDGAAD